MRVLVVGAGRAGARVLRQLHKNAQLTVLVADPQEKPYAVRAGLISAVDFQEALTPLTLDYVLAQAQPDLILLTTTTSDLGLGTPAGLDILAEALREEIAAIAEVPVIQVARTGY